MYWVFHVFCWPGEKNPPSLLRLEQLKGNSINNRKPPSPYSTLYPWAIKTAFLYADHVWLGQKAALTQGLELRSSWAIKAPRGMRAIKMKSHVGQSGRFEHSGHKSALIPSEPKQQRGVFSSTDNATRFIRYKCILFHKRHSKHISKCWKCILQRSSIT